MSNVAQNTSAKERERKRAKRPDSNSVQTACSSPEGVGQPVQAEPSILDLDQIDQVDVRERIQPLRDGVMTLHYAVRSLLDQVRPISEARVDAEAERLEDETRDLLSATFYTLSEFERRPLLAPTTDLRMWRGALARIRDDITRLHATVEWAVERGCEERRRRGDIVALDLSASDEADKALVDSLAAVAWLERRVADRLPEDS